MKRVRLLAVALVVAACGAPQPTLVVPLEIDWEGDFAVLVFDMSGLVDRGRQADQPDGPHPGGAAFARPDQSEIDLFWIGGACTHRPTITISGAANAVHLELHIVRDATSLPFLPVSCPLIGLPFGITLSLSVPVAQEAITFEFTR